MITAFLYLFSIAGMVSMGVVTLLRKFDKSSTYFGLMTLATATWLGLQFLATKYSALAHLFTVAGSVAFGFIPALCLLFTATFVTLDGHTMRRVKLASYMTGIACIILALLPDTFEKVSVVNDGLIVKTGFGYALQTSIAVLAVAAAVVVFAHNFKNLTSDKRSATNYLIIGLGVAAVGNFISGFVLVHDSGAQFVGPLSIFMMAILTSYAITRHRLFDIRMAIARSLAYISSLVVVAVLYGAVVFGSAAIIFHLHFSPRVTVFMSIATGIAALSFDRLKRWFDMQTNRLFYRDAYDPDELLGKLNALFVHSNDLEKLLMGSAMAIKEALRPEFCVFSISGSANYEKRVVGVGVDNYQHDSVDSHDVVGAMASAHSRIIVTDELTDQERRSMLQSKNIAVIVALTPKLSGAGFGFMVLGYRQSGTPYSVSDLRTLETLAGGMVIAIENGLRFEEIRNFNTTLRQKITKATTELRSTNERLRALDHTKDEFITMASHQLRTPLTSVKGYLSMVLEGDAGKLNANQEKLLEQSYLSSQRMVYLISDLLNLSRLNTGKFVIEPSEVDLSSVVQDEINQLTETAKSRSLNLVYAKPATFPKLMLDETKIHQVVMNFIDNAIYYTPSGGTVTVGLRETPTAVEYTVKDTGIGVPKSVQHKLFTKFYRAQNAQQARPDGTGLGLFMAKKVIAAQGGAIIFESEEGKGSTFGFRFNKPRRTMPNPTANNSNSKTVKKQPVRA